MNTQMMERQEFALPEGVRFTKTGLLLPEGLEPEQWVAVGGMLSSAHRALGLWHGDWVKHGRANYDAEFVSAALGQLELPLHKLERFELTAEVLPEHRSESLTEEHFFVAGKRLDNDADRERWLQLAEAEKLSPRELQASIRAGQVVHIDEAARRGWIPTPAAMRFAFEAWAKELGDGWMSWSVEDFPDVLEEFEPLLKFREQLLARYKDLKFDAAVRRSREVAE